MAQAREIYNAHGGNLLEHDHGVFNAGKERHTDTFKSNVAFDAPSTSQSYDFKSRDNRAK